MRMEEIIKAKIEASLSSTYVEVINESHKHAGHMGDDGSGETHFRLMVVSSAFENKNRIERHRTIHAILENELQNKIHALALKTYTPDEVKKNNKK